MSRRHIATVLASCLLFLSACNAAGETVTESGIIFLDSNGLRLCDLILTSYPPQCGSIVVKLHNPHDIDLHFNDYSSNLKWSPPVHVTGVMFFEGALLIEEVTLPK